MNWERYTNMAEWPYPLQETFKGATVLLMLLACLWLWRRWSGNPLRPSFGSISYVVCLALVTGMEFAAAVFRQISSISGLVTAMQVDSRQK